MARKSDPFKPETRGKDYKGFNDPRPRKLRLRNKITGQVVMSVGYTLQGAVKTLGWPKRDTQWIDLGPCMFVDPYIMSYAQPETPPAQPPTPTESEDK